jgi:hypothetical protein
MVRTHWNDEWNEDEEMENVLQGKDSTFQPMAVDIQFK